MTLRNSWHWSMRSLRSTAQPVVRVTALTVCSPIVPMIHAHWASLQRRGIQPRIARRRRPHGSGLGARRWVVERTHAWLHPFPRLRVRFQRRADIHEGFLLPGCALACWRTLQKSFGKAL